MPIDTSRQNLITGMTAERQMRLNNSRVLVIGAGGLATTALSYLTMAGVSYLTIVDFDHVEASNLHRQTLYTPDDINKNKAEAAKAYLCTRAPEAHINAIAHRLDDHALSAEIKKHDIVLDCTDNRAVSFQINDCATAVGKPVVFANASEMSGQLFVMVPKEKPYTTFRSIWANEPINHSNKKLGVIGPVPGMMGSLQALEAIKLLAAFSPVDDCALFHIDFRTLSIHKLKLKPDTA